MGGEKGGSKSSGFFHLFDWNRKSRKKLFSNSPDGIKQGKRSSDNLPVTQLHLIDEDEIFGVPSAKASSDYSCTSSVTDEEGNGTRVPGVVARLMGLDSMPTAVASEAYSTPFFDARSLRDNHSQKSPDLYTNEKFNHVSCKAEGYFKKPVDARSQKMPSSPIERFQREVLPPRLGKTLPLSHHKLLSPIKNPSFTSAKNAAQIMEAAAKIIEPGLQVHPSTKGRIGSPSIPIRVRDPKDSIAVSERTSRLLQLSGTPFEFADVQYSRVLPLNKNWNKTEDIVIVRSSPDPYDINADGARAKGKSISLAVQAKVNVQKRESLGNSSRSSLVQKEYEECKVNHPFRSQANYQKNKAPKKPSQANVSSVLRQNNQKQNCQSGKGKLGTKQSAQQHGRKLLSGDSSSVKNKNVNKVSGTSRVGCRKITGLDMEGSSSSNKDFPQKKRLIEGCFTLEKSSPIRNGLVNRHETHVISDTVKDELTRRSEDNKNVTDIISFTFTSPLIKSFGGSQSCNTMVLDKWEKVNACNFGNNFSDVSQRNLASAGSSVLSGDSLNHLLERKLLELTTAIEPSCDFTRAPQLAASAPSLQESKSACSGLNTLTAKQEFLRRPYKDKTSNAFDNEFSSTKGQVSSMKNKLLVTKEFESSCSNACMNPNYNHHSYYNHQSPLSVFDASFSSESFQLTECSGTSNGSNLCPSINAQNIVDLSSSRKSVEAEPELSDSASSVAKDPLGGLANNMKESEQELMYVRILCNKGLMFKDLDSYCLTNLAETFDDSLFFNDDKGVESKLLVDCVRECLELKHDHYFKAGYQGWVRGAIMITKKDLAQDVYNEISVLKNRGYWMVDELVDNDMSTHLGRWVDFEIEAFETGKQIQRQILSSLIDEILADFRVK